MSLQGVLVLNLIALALLLWVLNLVRHGRLYVGYGVIFVIAALGTTLLVSVPWLQTTLTHVIGAVFPVSALTLLALCFIVLMLLYTLTQLTIVSNRLSKLVQELAIERARAGATRTNAQPRVLRNQPSE
jgi:drug/metabolite transporter superfamily protein YnfA